MNRSKELKICFKDIVKRVKFPEEFDDLLNYVRSTFDLNQKNELSFFYVDDEEDKIIVKNEQEFKGAALYMDKFNKDVIKFFVVSQEDSNKPSEILLQNTENQSLNQFVKDFVVYCYNNYKQIKTQKELKDQGDNVHKVNNLKKLCKLQTWVKKASKILKGKLKKGPEDDSISFKLENNIDNNITIRYYYIRDNKTHVKTKRISIKKGSYNEEWEDEVGINKLENLFGHLYMNFATIEKEYDLNSF